MKNDINVKINTNYRCNTMDSIFDREIFPCCVARMVALIFFIISICLYFGSGISFGRGYYETFIYLMIGGKMSYLISWLSLKQMYWTKLKNININYINCCKQKFHEHDIKKD